PYITVGFLALLLLLPLAITSTHKMIKRLGAKRWNKLHKLVYLSAILVILHYLWLVKKDLTDPLIYGGILALLLGVRLFDFIRRKRLKNRPA
ncbi:MAG: sulfoxide reductase heme-binding subunit YedZ, partial [Proteobacteria bacterium]